MADKRDYLNIPPLGGAGAPIDDGYALKGNFVYVVQWPDGVLKVGYASARYRWRTFVCRGAELVQLISFNSYADASSAESSAHEWMRERYNRAFESREEAKVHLGGGGYLDCYYIPECHRG